LRGSEPRGGGIKQLSTGRKAKKSIEKGATGGAEKLQKRVGRANKRDQKGTTPKKVAKKAVRKGGHEEGVGLRGRARKN